MPMPDDNSRCVGLDPCSGQAWVGVVLSQAQRMRHLTGPRRPPGGRTGNVTAAFLWGGSYLEQSPGRCILLFSVNQLLDGQLPGLSSYKPPGRISMFLSYRWSASRMSDRCWCKNVYGAIALIGAA